MRPVTDEPEAADAPIRVRRRSRSWRRRLLRRRILTGLAVVGGIALLGAIQLAVAAWQLQTTAQRVAQAQYLLSQGDVDGAQRMTADAHSSARLADVASFGPHLWLAELVPVAGENARAIRRVADVSNELTGPVAEELFDLRRILDPEAIRPVDGQVDLSRFEAAVPRMRSVSESVAAADDRVDGLRPRRLVGPLRTGVVDVTDEITALRELTGLADNVLEMMPALLGADGRRTYLVVFQNNAEFRSTGGIPGAFSILEVNGGKLRMREQGEGRALGGRRERSVLPQTREEQDLFGGKLGRFVQNVNLTPDWSRSGELLAAMWDQVADRPVHGVISVDPVVLSYVLRGTGPVGLPDGKVATPETAVQALLNQPYFDYEDQLTQDEFFEESSRRIFDQLVQGKGDAGEALRGLHEGVREGRGFAWLRDPEEQQRIASSRVAGLLPEETTERPNVGVYLNDATGTKLDYYVTSRTDVTRVGCSGGGQRLLVETTLASAVPDGAGEFPALLLGAPVAGAPKGALLVNVLAYGPAGSTIVDPTLDGDRGSPADYVHDGRPVVVRTVLLEPGQTVKVAWSVDTADGQLGAPVVRTTPGAWFSGIGSVEGRSCG